MEAPTTKTQVPRWPAAILAVLALAYAAVFISQMSEAYIDFGDGNYLYIARRLTQGVVLYRDILSPQPPIHVCAGALLLKLGDLFGQPLYTVRAFSMLLHLATMWIVAWIARKVFSSRGEAFATIAALAAAALYLMLPIGFWWSFGYQSEPFEMAFLLASTLFFLDFAPRSMLIAGLLAAGAPFCNMTAVPFLVFNALFLLVCRRRLLLYYLAPILVLGCVVAGAFEAVTGAFFQNVFFNQVGTFPKEEILRLHPSGPQTLAQYVIHKIVVYGSKALWLDGPWILWGVAGVFLVPQDGNEERPLRSYTAWLLVAGLLSICFVAKGATVEYIFTLGEPILCVLGGGLWASLLGVPPLGGPFSPIPSDETTPTARLKAVHLAVALAGVVWFAFSGVPLIYATLRGDQWEMKNDAVQAVKELVDRYSKPGDAIIAHPYFAFITNRRLVEEYSEVFIWNIKYANEVEVDKKPGEGVAKINAMAALLRERRVPIVFLDMIQTGKVREIREALEGRYRVIKDIRPRGALILHPPEPGVWYATLNFPFLVLAPEQ